MSNDSSDDSTTVAEEVEYSKVMGKSDHDDHQENHVVKDIIMWRRWKLSTLLLVGTTAVWVLLQIYRFKFTPLASWVAMAFVTLLFLYGSILRLLRREVPNMEGWEITEERANDMSISTKRVMEKGIRLMFNVSCEREWYIFAAVISSLLLLAYVGHSFDLLTLLFTGTVVGTTVPVIYAKREDEIKAFGQRLRVQGRRLYDKVVSKLISKEKKGKKVE